MNIPLMANFLSSFPATAATLAKKFALKMASVADKTDPMTMVALICGCQILFALSVFFFMSRKTEPMTINVNVSNTSEGAQPIEEERPAAQEPLVPIRVPKPRHSFRQLHDYLVDGQPIRHRVRGHEYFYATYNANSNNIVCTDGTIVKSLSGLAVHNIRQTNPNLVNPQADGWARCEVQIEDGSWVKANTLVV